MGIQDIFIWIVLIYIADMAAARTRLWWSNRRKPKIQTCDYCHEPLKIFRTRDKKYWLCWDCRKAYYETQRRKRKEERRLKQEQAANIESETV